MDTDKWHRLSPGDIFSLLVDKYIFKVLSTSSEMESLLSRKNDNFGVEDIPNQSTSLLQQTKMSHRQPSQQQTTSSKDSQIVALHSIIEKTAEPPKKFSDSIPENEKPRLAQKKRVLPAWMLQSDMMAHSPSASGSGRGNSGNGGKKQKMTESEDVVHTAQFSQDMERLPTEPVLRKMEKSKSKTVSQKATNPAEQGNCQLQNEELELSPDGQACLPTEADTSNKKQNRLENANCKSEQFHLDKLSQSPIHQGENQDLPLNQASEIVNSDLAESQDVPQSPNITRPQRTACQYGRICYRKNPIHFQQFSHPGDNDYHEMEPVAQADNDNRPECPYGTACYRKNPQHKLEYKHTAPPELERRQTRPKALKKGRGVLDEDSDDDGEPNEYNLNDSFIDDEEVEEYDPTDEDSDWEPELEDEDNEDVDTLLKEAQHLVKTKK